MHEAKSRLSELGEMAWQGDEIVIARSGKPYLDLLPHRGQHANRQPGAWRGRVEIAADFDPTPADTLAEFET